MFAKAMAHIFLGIWLGNSLLRTAILSSEIEESKKTSQILYIAS